ncbi:MAG: serine protease [bacterium]|nr:serine protease [bacterium]
MKRFVPYLGIVAALVLGAIVVSLSGSVTVVRTPAPAISTASSTLSIEQGFILPPIALPNLEPQTDTATTSKPQATTTPKKVPSPAPKQTPVPVQVVAPVPVPPPVSTPAPIPPSDNAALDASASVLRSALVNIICYVPQGGGLHSISGSGIIVDSKGIILTNAHIAQYFLLTDRGADCTIRTGSPAADSYNASLIYISPAWLHANATVLTQTNPIGTGEYDFALLAVIKSVTRNALPVSFPFMLLATTPPNTGTSVVIATYGAQFLESSQIQSSLFPTVVFGSVKDVFTFAVNTIDVLALGGSAAAQEGSSGGGIADARGMLVGTITTSTTQGTTDTRSLDAITASYIRAAYASETGSALDLLLAEPTATAVAAFAPKMPALESILTAQLH